MVKALYLSSYGLASKKIREAAKEAIKLNNLNALVIDVKGDQGFIPFKVDIPLAEEVGAQKTILFKDMKAVVASLKEQGLYLIARIVVFKDDPLAAARPQWAVKTKGGGVFRDRERLRWIDPFQQGGLGLQHRHRQGCCGSGFRRGPVRLCPLPGQPQGGVFQAGESGQPHRGDQRFPEGGAPGPGAL